MTESTTTAPTTTSTSANGTNNNSSSNSNTPAPAPAASASASASNPSTTRSTSPPTHQTPPKPLTSSSPDSLNLRALLSTKEAGIVIGRDGKNVAVVRTSASVKAGVSKVVDYVADRVLTVSGSVEGVSKAYSLIAQTLIENPIAGSPPSTPISPANAGTTTLRLLVSHGQMGGLIGKAGAKIKEIQDASGARMVAHKGLLPQSTERIVELSGSTEAIRLAVWEIGKVLVEDFQRAQGTVLFHPQSIAPDSLPPGGILSATGAYLPNSRRGRNNSSHNTGSYSGNNNNNNNNSYNNRRSNQNTSPSSNNNTDTPNGNSNTNSNENANTNNNTSSNNNNGSSSNNNNNTNNNNGNSKSISGAVSITSSFTNVSTAPSVPTPSDHSLRTQNISIPSDMVGCIIGRGGSKINEIRRLSGSKISIAKTAHDETGERMFTITGPPKANESALYLLYNQLESEKERRLTLQRQQRRQDDDDNTPENGSSNGNNADSNDANNNASSDAPREDS